MIVATHLMCKIVNQFWKSRAKPFDWTSLPLCNPWTAHGRHWGRMRARNFFFCFGIDAVPTAHNCNCHCAWVGECVPVCVHLIVHTLGCALFSVALRCEYAAIMRLNLPLTENMQFTVMYFVSYYLLLVHVLMLVATGANDWLTGRLTDWLTD